MARPLATGARRAPWNLLLLSGLTVFCLRPLFRTGYLCDDNIDSLLPGMLLVEGYSLPEYIGRAVVNFLKGSRLFPLQMAHLYALFYFVQNLFVYKAMVVGLVVLDLALFCRFVRKVSRNREFAVFATCLVLPLFQFRDFFDPLLSFYCLLQLVVAGVLVSLLALLRYLETGRARWLGLSLAAYLAVMLTYEVTYPLFLLHALLIVFARPGWKARAALGLPFAASAVGCVLASTALRWFFLSPSSDYRINTDPSAFLVTLWRQTASGLPLSYFAVNHAGLYPSLGDPVGLARFAATAGGAAVFLGALAVGFRSLRAAPAGDERLPGDRRALLLLLGLGLAVLPAVLVSVSTRHQKMILPGMGYLPVYVQYFGVALVGATLAWGALARTARGGTPRLALQVATALLLAATATLNYRANAVLADYLPKAPDAPDYNRVVGDVQGAWNRHRDNLEVALHAGLVDEVPRHATVRLANEYPAWHNNAHSAYFYAMHSGKVLRTVPSTSVFAQDCWFFRKDTLKPQSPPPGTPEYHLRDVCLAERTGYVVLSRDGVPGKPGAVRLFVRHPKLFADGPSPALVVAARTAGGGSEVVRRGCELAPVRSGRDWAILTLGPDPEGVDPGSVTVAFGTVSAAWGEGFYGPEIDDGRYFRWCQQRGVLTLNNATDAPRKARISLQVQNRGDAPVVLDGGPIREQVRTGKDPVALVREVTLAPGANRLDLSSEASAVPTDPRDLRRLHFRVIGFKVRDEGPLPFADRQTAARRPAAQRR